MKIVSDILLLSDHEVHVLCESHLDEFLILIVKKFIYVTLTCT